MHWGQTIPAKGGTGCCVECRTGLQGGGPGESSSNATTLGEGDGTKRHRRLAHGPATDCGNGARNIRDCRPVNRKDAASIRSVKKKGRAGLRSRSVSDM